MTDPIIISSANIKINSDGLYCLNDLHKAGGGDKKHLPTAFFRNQQTIDIVAELNNPNCASDTQLTVVKESGRYGGTYVCEELVYTYAMWVSPKFHIEVVRYFAINNKVKNKLNKLVDSVHALGEGVTKHLDEACLTFDDMGKHGSNWGSYGASIRKAKRECRKVMFELADKMQLKLELK
jgi:hypothetical protein